MKWINVKDQKPPIDKTLLVFDESEGMCTGYFDGRTNFTLSVMGDFASGGALFHVTHWMPLPDAP